VTQLVSHHAEQSKTVFPLGYDECQCVQIEHSGGETSREEEGASPDPCFFRVING
jgi:hypothetical protein